MNLRIILADDHKLFREGMRNLLEKRHDVKVIAEAANGREVLHLVEQHSPDLVIMDISMPELNGIEATRKIRTLFQMVRVIALSMHSDRKFVSEMLSAGASGYLLKDCAFEELAQAIHSVQSNRVYVSPEVAGSVIQSYIKHDGIEAAETPYMTAKEREVLQMIAEGKSTKDIASSLNISIKTVETHRQNIMQKLKITSVAELTKYAIREGFTSLDH